ncbi:MAG: pirin family protein [Deltaproteobacteria bacterium]|nr:pirin family protein [Deltaproteobacteria bacterium]
MITLRKADERGGMEIDWLKTRHSFSFGRYYDPRHMGFRSLRVINDDVIAPSGGFPMHPHDNMEIVTYVTAGTLDHEDSMGNRESIRRGEVQRMSAGTGVVHSEFNPSPDEETRLLQIWLLPAKNGIEPGYEQKRFSDDEKRDRLRLIVSPNADDGTMTMHQDAFLYASILGAGKELQHALAPGRHAWIQIVAGAMDVNGQTLRTGDGAAVSEETELRFRADEETEFLLFDLA